MFRGLFSKQNDEEEEYFEKVDPVVEQRRKEKFSTPLIYDDEFRQEEIEKKAVVQKAEKKIVTEAAPISVVDEKPAKSGYQPLEVISPMRGAPVSKNKPVEKTVILKPKARKYEEQLVPVISPYFGMSKNAKIEEEEDILLQPTTTMSDPDVAEVKKAVEPIVTVEDNLRNIAKIVEEEQDQLKIIEERTGEFKLDFSNTKQEEEPSLIDEIDDNMSLDELMSLYEKKFTD